MSFLIALLLFFHLIDDKSKCPMMHREVMPIYAEIGSPEYYQWITEEIEKGKNNPEWIGVIATTTGDGLVQIGEAENPAEIEYNKKVEECRIANGEF